MKKIVILSSLLGLCLAGTAYADDNAVVLEDQSIAGANLSSNAAQNPFTPSPIDNLESQPQPDTAGQLADDSDSW